MIEDRPARIDIVRDESHRCLITHVCETHGIELHDTHEFSVQISLPDFGRRFSSQNFGSAILAFESEVGQVARRHEGAASLGFGPEFTIALQTEKMRGGVLFEGRVSHPEDPTVWTLYFAFVDERRNSLEKLQKHLGQLLAQLRDPYFRHPSRQRWVRDNGSFPAV